MRNESEELSVTDPAPEADSPVIKVYAPGFKTVLQFSRGGLWQIPPDADRIARLVLCANFRADSPHDSCPLGTACKFVHADRALALRVDGDHVNYALRRVSDSLYPRFEEGTVLHVAAPNSPDTSDVIESHMVLKTQALNAARRPLTHCAHYYFNRSCHQGANCNFIHAVFIDPNARPFQRAPVPVSLGRVDHKNARRGGQPISAAPIGATVDVQCGGSTTYATNTTGNDAVTGRHRPVLNKLLLAAHVAACPNSQQLSHPAIGLTVYEAAPPRLHRHSSGGNLQSESVRGAAPPAAYLGVPKTSSDTPDGRHTPPLPEATLNSTPPITGSFTARRSRHSSMASVSSSTLLSPRIALPPATSRPGSAVGAEGTPRSVATPMLEGSNGSFAASVASDAETTSRGPTRASRFRHDPYSPNATPVFYNATDQN